MTGVLDQPPAILALGTTLSLCVGTLMAVIGGGGSLVYVIMLMVTFRLPPSVAVGTGLLLAVVGTAGSTVAHARCRNVEWGPLRGLATVGTIGALAGALAVPLLPEPVLGWFVVILFLVLGLHPLLASRRAGSGRHRRPESEQPQPVVTGLLVPGLLGVGVGAFGISGGTPLASFLASRRGLPPARAVGTALGAVLPMSVTAAALHFGRGDFSAEWFAVMALGVMAGSVCGARLSGRLNPRVLATTLAVLTLASSIGLAIQIWTN